MVLSPATTITATAKSPRNTPVTVQATAARAFDLAVVRLCAALGVMLYGGVGVASMLGGGNFLDYDVLAHDPVHGQHLGILLIELGVGVTVASIMILIFLAFALRAGGRPRP